MSEVKQPTIAFDVDGTLIDECDTPRYEVIALFRLLANWGCELYIWSGGGVDYALRWRDRLGLNAEVVAKGSFQPDIAIDDMIDMQLRKSEKSLGKVNLFVGSADE